MFFKIELLSPSSIKKDPDLHVLPGREREDPQLHAMGSWKTMLEVMMLLSSLQKMIEEQKDEDSLQMPLMPRVLQSTKMKDKVFRRGFQLQRSVS
jgi:hypothetical protein